MYDPEYYFQNFHNILYAKEYYKLNFCSKLLFKFLCILQCILLLKLNRNYKLVNVNASSYLAENMPKGIFLLYALQFKTTFPEYGLKILNNAMMLS